MVASGLGLLLVLAVAALSLYGGRSFAAMTNYVDMDQRGQLALDRMSREIRQCKGLTYLSPAHITFRDADDQLVDFYHDAASRRLIRASGGETNIFLIGCESLQFSAFQHTVQSNSFVCYGTPYLADVKLVQVTWTCSRAILGAKVNTESVQSAQIAIRN